MADRQPAARTDLLLSTAALALLVCWEASGWDLRLIRVYGDAGGFAWRDHWLAAALLHDGGRWLAGACLTLLAWDAFRPAGTGPSCAERRYWLAIVIASLVLIPSLKRFTTTSCPWDLIEFGGRAAYVPHWLPGVRDGGPGHCFPAGHPVSAFAFFGAYFLWRPYRARLAYGVLGATVLLGTLFTWTQMARGAHFASHGLWSAWLCWTLSAAAQRLSPLKERSRLSSPGPRLLCK